MKTTVQLALLATLAVLLTAAACANTAPAPEGAKCGTKYVALAETLPVTGDPAGGVTLFEVTDLDTACFDELRVFVHVMNEAYETAPYTSDARLVVRAFHGIGQGSWGYFSQEFPMQFTSQLHGFSQIPVMGETTRLVVFGYNLPAVELEVDVAAYLVE